MQNSVDERMRDAVPFVDLRDFDTLAARLGWSLEPSDSGSNPNGSNQTGSNLNGSSTNGQIAGGFA